MFALDTLSPTKEAVPDDQSPKILEDMRTTIAGTTAILFAAQNFGARRLLGEAISLSTFVAQWVAEGRSIELLEEPTTRIFAYGPRNTMVIATVSQLPKHAIPCRCGHRFVPPHLQLDETGSPMCPTCALACRYLTKLRSIQYAKRYQDAQR